MRAITMALALTLMTGFGVRAQEDKPAWSLDDLVWLEGCWEGTAFDGIGKECWVTGPDGHMTGLFQLEEEGEIVFTEIMYIREFEEGAGLAVKHFNPDFSAWEEKADYHLFKLESTRPGKAQFSGLTLRREEPDTLVIELRMKDDAGKVRTEIMRFHRLEGEVRAIPLTE